MFLAISPVLLVVSTVASGTPTEQFGVTVVQSLYTDGDLTTANDSRCLTFLVGSLVELVVNQ